MKTYTHPIRSSSRQQQDNSIPSIRMQEGSTPTTTREVAQLQQLTEIKTSLREQRLQVMQMQRESALPTREPQPLQRRENKTGMPDRLLHNVEAMSGFDMSDVRVHYNSPKPAQLQAHAYAQGNQIHLGPGQEKHLPHEAWHVVQQKQGRVKATMQLKGVGVNINDDVGLEREADVMGGKASLFHQIKTNSILPIQTFKSFPASQTTWAVTQLNGDGLGFQGTITHYLKKIPDLADLLTSHRRQKMLATTTFARQIAKSIGPEYVKANKVKLVHANDDSKGSKTWHRKEALEKKYDNAPAKISKKVLNQVMPSVDDMQVAKASGKYVSLQGVGRISAVKLAFPDSEIEVDMYELPGFIITCLQDISDSYKQDEGLMGKAIGTASTIFIGASGYYAAPYVASAAASAASYFKSLFK